MVDLVYFFRICLVLVIVLCTVSQTDSQNRNEPDLCRTNPCANKGLCVQTNISPGYKCQCYGTGFYGPRCKQACPKNKDEPSKRTKVFPAECVVI